MKHFLFNCVIILIEQHFMKSSKKFLRKQKNQKYNKHRHYHLKNQLDHQLLILLVYLKTKYNKVV